MIGFLFQGRVRIRVRVRVTFNVSVYHWSNCRTSKCRIFSPEYTQAGVYRKCVLLAKSFCLQWVK